METVKFSGKVFLFIVFLALLLGLLGWVLLPVRIFSVNNVERQWQFAYQYIESLQAIAQQACIAEEAVKNAVTTDERIQRQSQLIAVEQNYSRVAAEFDARLRNAFEAGLVAPPDVPRSAPSLDVMKSQVCH